MNEFLKYNNYRSSPKLVKTMPDGQTSNPLVFFVNHVVPRLC